MARRTGFPAGKLDKRVVFLRRESIDPSFNAGNTLGEFKPLFSRWAAVYERTTAKINETGAAQNALGLNLVVRTDAETRGITVEDRVTLENQEFAIKGIGLPDRIGQIITFEIETLRGG